MTPEGGSVVGARVGATDVVGTGVEVTVEDIGEETQNRGWYYDRVTQDM